MSERSLYVYDVAGREHMILLHETEKVVDSGKRLYVMDQAGRKQTFNINNVVRWVIK